MNLTPVVTAGEHADRRPVLGDQLSDSSTWDW